MGISSPASVAPAPLKSAKEEPGSHSGKQHLLERAVPTELKTKRTGVFEVFSLSKALAHSSEAPRRAPIPIRLISHPGQSPPTRDPLMPSNGCLMTLIKGVNVLMEPFEDRPNLYEDQFSQFIRKEPADGEKQSFIFNGLCRDRTSSLSNLSRFIKQVDVLASKALPNDREASWD
ncbi:hypothetical protein EYF80_000135 [Liparis tanakae]|uniref:Uncharacterized protein n=1 Tax=Liparis tanakae TaxID=230148 RepID=A0A4Z2JJW1_9TELE|nr:hypothetical protein EYF80_000135 [Liparis tanakae]